VPVPGAMGYRSSRAGSSAPTGAGYPEGVTSYPTPAFRRTALAPALLGAVAALAGVALVDGDGFTIVRYVICILALIVAWFALQARHWWWLVLLVPIALAWNPVFPLDLDHDTWLLLHYLAAATFIAVGILVRVRNPEDRNQRPTR